MQHDNKNNAGAIMAPQSAVFFGGATFEDYVPDSLKLVAVNPIGLDLLIDNRGGREIAGTMN